MMQMASQLAGVWKAWPWNKRLSVVLGVGVGMAAFVALVVWSTRPNFAPLISGLSREDASEIVQKLEDERIPYELAANGRSIRVPEEKVHRTRLLLAGQGLPKGGGVGFELFDETNIGISRFTEKVNYRRALEGELRRTLSAMEGVRDARVHIVMPEKSLFRDRQERATASVSLQLHGNYELDKRQVRSVVHLVASSVEGLTPNFVTVVDHRGSILSRGDEESGALSSELERQQAIEKNTEERIRQILGRVVGPDNLAVRVTAEVDLTRRETTQEVYDPDGVAVRSEQSSDEQRTQGGSRGAVPGARSNLTGLTAGRAGTGTSGANNKRALTRNYEVSKEITHRTAPAGSLQRLSIAVLVNHVSRIDAEGKRSLVPRSESELEQLAELTRKASGFDSERGDQVVIHSLAFADADIAPEVVEKPEWSKWVDTFWRPAVALLLLIVVGLTARVRARHWRAQRF